MHRTAPWAAGLAALLACAAASAAGPSTAVVVSGAVDKPTPFTAAVLMFAGLAGLGALALARGTRRSRATA